MLTLTTWFVIVVLSAIAILGMQQLSEAADGSKLATSIPHRVLTALLSTIVLVVLTLIWQVREVAQLDGHIIDELAKSRSVTLTQIMSFVTTMGDAIPTFMIGAVLALIIYCQVRRTWLVILLPLVVLVELAIQIAMSKSFDVVTAADVVPHLIEGGSGSLPSGSVARLFSLFFVAAHICGSRQQRVARRLATLGSVLVLVQIISRLYLARHLVGDIVGGLALGLALERLGASVVTWNDGRLEQHRLPSGYQGKTPERQGSVSET